MTGVRQQREGAALHCTQCDTELAPAVLSCPVCNALVHAGHLKDLAAAAASQTAEGRLEDARDSWQNALELLPSTSQQHATVRGRIDELTKRIATTPSTRREAPADGRPWWKRATAAFVIVGLFALTKLKFLLLGLSKASTFFSMFAFFGVYWAQFGWALAAGLVVSIYIHEMGHVSELRRLGIAAGAPLFIPGIGALVLLKQHIDDPATDARIGLAGPVWGLGAGLAAYAVFRITGAPIWGAIAQLTGFINLFNLIPVWQLDGSRGFHALSRSQRWVVVATLAAAFWLTNQGLLLLIGGVAIYRALQPAEPKPNSAALATFLMLIVALTWLATIPAVSL
jgi:Zn-dependent protease